MPPRSVDEVVEILRLDEINRFPDAVAFIAGQKGVRARALQGQLELAWAEGLSLLAEMNQNLAGRLRELTALSETKAAAAEHLARGLAIASQVIKANPDNYLGYRVAADSYRLQRDWKAFDRMLAKVEKTNANSRSGGGAARSRWRVGGEVPLSGAAEGSKVRAGTSDQPTSSVRRLDGRDDGQARRTLNEPTASLSLPGRGLG